MHLNRLATLEMCSRQTGDYMANVNYHVFGIGSGTAEDLRYIGWTQKSLSEEKKQIVSDLVQSSCNCIRSWVGDGGAISIFEIESASSVEDAKDAATFWCRYFRSLGLDVITDHN
jgi:hypothetical protein